MDELARLEMLVATLQGTLPIAQRVAVAAISQRLFGVLRDALMTAHEADKHVSKIYERITNLERKLQNVNPH